MRRGEIDVKFGTSGMIYKKEPVKISGAKGEYYE